MPGPTHKDAFRSRGNPTTTPRLADNCLHVFLDVGANRGVHMRYLLEPQVFQEAPYVGWGFFSAAFGPHYQNDSRVCVFGFEPNPAHAARLERLARHWRAARRVVEVFAAAVSGDRPGTTLLYRQHDDGRDSDWDFGRKALTGQRMGSGVHVPTVQLASFVEHELVPRVLPPARPGDRPPAILMKMDVEGGEMEVLENLRKRGVLCHLALVTAEFHPRLWRAPYAAGLRAYAALLRFVAQHSEEPPGDSADVRLLLPAAERRFAPTCAVRFVHRDDETNLNLADLPARPWEPSLHAWAVTSLKSAAPQHQGSAKPKGVVSS